jgi:hypothetical protein
MGYADRIAVGVSHGVESCYRVLANAIDIKSAALQSVG